jgi:hypothetical protein
MARQLKAKLDLDTTEATRAARQFASSLRDTGQAGQSAMSGINGQLGSMGTLLGTAGVAGAVTTIIGLYREMHESVIAVNQAVAAGLDAQQQRINSMSSEFAGPVFNQLREVTGWTPDEAMRNTLQLSGDFGVQDPDVIQAMLRVNSLVESGAQGDALRDVLMISRARGADAEGAGILTGTLRNQYGMRDRSDYQQGLAEAAAAARDSSYTMADLSGVVSRSAPTAIAAGASYQELLAITSGLSLSYADSPERAATAVEQMSRAMVQGDPEFLARIGMDMESPNLMGLINAVGGYIEGAGSDGERLQRIREAMDAGIPSEAIQQVLKVSGPAFERQYNIAMGAMGGADWQRDVASPFAQIQATESSQNFRAQQYARAADYTPATPGSDIEARNIMEFMGNMAVGSAGAAYHDQSQQLLVDSGDMIRAPEALTPEEAQKLWRLNRIYDGVVPGLRQLAAQRPTASQGTSFGSGGINYRSREGLRADALLYELQEARRAANNHAIVGTQGQHIVLYENKLIEAIDFLRDLSLNQATDEVGSEGEFFRDRNSGDYQLRFGDRGAGVSYGAAEWRTETDVRLAREAVSSMAPYITIQNQYNTTPGSIANNTATRTD